MVTSPKDSQVDMVSMQKGMASTIALRAVVFLGVLLVLHDAHLRYLDAFNKRPLHKPLCRTTFTHTRFPLLLFTSMDNLVRQTDASISSLSQLSECNG